MDIQQLKQQVTKVLQAVSIEESERHDLLSRIESSTQEQLEQLEDNLLRQLAADTYFQFLEDLEKQDRLLDEEDVPALEEEIMEHIKTKQSLVLTQAQIDQVRAHLGEISHTASPVSETPPPPSGDAAPAQ